MMKALVIKTVGDPELCGAIADGISRKIIPLNAEELSIVKAELARLQAAHGVMKQRDNRYWNDKINALPERYKDKKIGCVHRSILVAWATLWAIIFDAHAHLSAWNRAS